MLSCIIVGEFLLVMGMPKKRDDKKIPEKQKQAIAESLAELFFNHFQSTNGSHITNSNLSHKVEVSEDSSPCAVD